MEVLTADQITTLTSTVPTLFSTMASTLVSVSGIIIAVVAGKWGIGFVRKLLKGRV